MTDITPARHPTPELLRRFALGRLSAEEARGIETHVEHCPDCCRTLGQGGPEADPLAQWLRHAADSTPSAPEPATAALPDGDTGALAAPPLGLLGRYEILGELGRGGMGIVYKARDVRLRRLVALKMIRGGSFDDAENRARFHAEGLAVARLRHPHIVQLLEVGEEDGTPYQVLEYLDGGSLAEHARHRPQECSHAARLVQVLADALAHAHEQGVIHRDLKPANVLLTADGVAKVTDFGLAKFDRRLQETLSLRDTTTGTILGTPQYMSPEQARGVPGTIGPATDIYALGVILYELLTGQPPFAGTGGPLEILQALQEREPAPPRRLRPEVPRDLDMICLKCLHKEPPHRYHTAGDLAVELGRFLRGEPIRARPLSGRERAGRWVRRNPLAASLLGGLAAVILAALAGLGTLYLHADAQRRRAEQNERDALRLAQEAQRQKAEADRQREDALAFFDVARRAVETFHTRVMTDPKLKEHDFRALRLALLASTVQFHEALIQRKSNDPALHVVQGRAFRQLGDLHKELGRIDDALRAYGQAVTLLHGLRDRHPGNTVIVADLVAALHNRALLQVSLGRHPEAFADYRALLPLQEVLAAQKPGRPEWKTNLVGMRGNFAHLLWHAGQRAEALETLRRNLAYMEEMAATDPQPLHRASLASLRNNLAAYYLELGQPDTALPLVHAARDEQARLAAEHPDDPRFRYGLVQTSITLSNALLRTGRTEEALATNREGLRVARELVRQHPSVPAYRESLGGLACNTGVLLSGKEDSAQALAHFDEALRELEQVRQAAPQLVDAETFQCNALMGRAELLGALGRHADALRDWDRALPLDAAANRPWTVLRRARTLLWLGRLSEGIAALEPALPADSGPDLRFFAASVWSLAAAQTRDDSATAAHALTQALQLLQRLATTGYLQQPKASQLLRTLPEFAPVRRLLTLPGRVTKV